MQTQIRRRLLISTLFSTTWKVTVWQMKELKTYLRRSLTTFWPNFFMNTRRNQHQFPIFSAELSRMKRSVELLSRATRTIYFKAASSSAVYKFEWFSQQPTLTFLHPYFMMRKLKYSRIDRNPFPNFSNLQLLTLPSNSVINRSWSLFCLSCSRHEKHVTAEALWIQVTRSMF